MDLQPALTFAKQIATVVGARIAQEVSTSGALEVSEKAKNDLVTQIDVWSEATIREALFKEFPDHQLIGEEDAKALIVRAGISLQDYSSKGCCWIVDPLDGTTNFINRIPHVGVSLALLVDGIRQVGVIYDPFRKELFHGVRGQGAFLNDSPIRVSEKTALKDSVVATGFPHDRAVRWHRYKPAAEILFRTARGVRRFGAATLDQCWVACGRFDAFFEYGLSSWDVAAGSLIVEEAGGVAKNLVNAGKDPFTSFSESFLFSGNKLMPEMLKQLLDADIAARALEQA